MSVKTREKLIEVARHLFTLKGVAHTTMKDIANASAKGRRTIYMYFKNKKDIYNAVLEEESERMVKSLRDIVNKQAPVETRLTEFLRLRLERYINPVQGSSIKGWLTFDGKRIDKAQSIAREKESAMISQLLEEGILEGRFRADRCRMVSTFISRAMTLGDTVVLDDGETLDERINSIETFIEFIVTDLIIKEDKNDE